MSIREVSIEQPDGSLTVHVIIDNEDGSFTSMPKSVYDEQLANEAKTK